MQTKQCPTCSLEFTQESTGRKGQAWLNRTFCSKKCDRGKLKHGGTGSAIYRRYMHIKSRCINPNEKCYPDYGGRGIKFLWKSFEDFKKDMGDSFIKHIKEHGSSNTQIERIDNDGHYCKENCRWATRKEQGANKRNNILYTYEGKTFILAEWSRILNIPNKILHERLRRRNWTFERAISQPIRKR